MNQLKISILTDEDILNYSDDRVLTDHRDINLNYTSFIKPYKGGVYDEYIFGSPYTDRCRCKKTKGVGITCSRCGSSILTESEMYTRYARIESPIMYLNELRFQSFKKLFLNTFSSIEIKLDTIEGVLSKKVFDCCQFSYDEASEVLIISDTVDDLSKCSYEGIIKIAQDHFQSSLSDFKSLVNNYVLVTPPIMRMFQVTYVKEERKIAIPELTASYQAIIYSIKHLELIKSSFADLSEIAVVQGIIRRFIDIAVSNTICINTIISTIPSLLT
jgi:hypothetical protein